ncbi:MAG: hypothetical protein EB127_19305, partial [Alphaproteobacteria bacterium]|nr:hypothetical protein [Alphaproteobacteria bacterium]
KTQSDGTFRVAAYNKVIGKMNGLDTIRSLEDLEGILPKTKGSEIRKKVIEVLETGSLASAEAIKANPTNDILELFQGIYGIGPKAAQELIDLGMKSIGDLRSHPELLNKKQAIGLAFRVLRWLPMRAYCLRLCRRALLELSRAPIAAENPLQAMWICFCVLAMRRY